MSVRNLMYNNFREQYTCLICCLHALVNVMLPTSLSLLAMTDECKLVYHSHKKEYLCSAAFVAEHKRSNLIIEKSHIYFFPNYYATSNLLKVWDCLYIYTYRAEVNSCPINYQQSTLPDPPHALQALFSSPVPRHFEQDCLLII